MLTQEINIIKLICRKKIKSTYGALVLFTKIKLMMSHQKIGSISFLFNLLLLMDLHFGQPTWVVTTLSQCLQNKG